MEARTMNDTPPRFAWDWVGWWTLVFVANLPVPLLFSWGTVSNGCGYGLFGAITMLYMLGATTCGLRWRVGRSLVWGGAVLIPTQLFPLLQIASGYFALEVWAEVTGVPTLSRGFVDEGSDGWQLVNGNFGVCAVVFLTAQPLLVLALLIGAGLRWWAGDHPIWFARHTDPDADGS